MERDLDPWKKHLLASKPPHRRPKSDWDGLSETRSSFSHAPRHLASAQKQPPWKGGDPTPEAAGAKRPGGAIGSDLWGAEKLGLDLSDRPHLRP